MAKLQQKMTLLNIVVIGVVLSFFGLAPLVGFPATWEESLGLALAVTPVFLGNIGFAAAYAAQPSLKGGAVGDDRLPLITLLAYGSILLFALVALAFCAAFWISNRHGQLATGSGMSLQTLQAAIAASLSTNTVTSNHLMARIFPTSRRGR
jgi:hypothetical protein